MEGGEPAVTRVFWRTTAPPLGERIRLVTKACEFLVWTGKRFYWEADSDGSLQTQECWPPEVGGPFREVVTPDPGQWHRDYRHLPGLVAWLKRGNVVDLQLAGAARMRKAQIYATGRVKVIPNALLRRHAAIGPAPFVGQPFVYTWRFAVDQSGRSIATESRIEYLP